MQVESNISPNKYEIENVSGSRCDIILNTNISAETRKDENDEEKKVYLYDTYRISHSYNNNINEFIEKNYNELIEFAQNEEKDELSQEARAKREKLLLDSDWTDLVHSPLIDEQKEKWEEYRQALRDISKQENFPYKIEWPQKP